MVYYIQFGVQNLFTLAKILKSFSSLERPQIRVSEQRISRKKSKSKISSRYNHKKSGVFENLRHILREVIHEIGRIFMPRKSFPVFPEKIESVFQFWHCIFIHFKPHALYGKHPVGAQFAPLRGAVRFVGVDVPIDPSAQRPGGRRADVGIRPYGRNPRAWL